MAKITLKLPHSLSREALDLDVVRLDEVPSLIREVDAKIYDALYFEVDSKSLVKPYASMFVNGRIYFGNDRNLVDGDRLEIIFAIAGG